MPWTLYRYMVGELVRFTALTVVVLTLVISVAVSIKPMMNGLLGPVTLLKFIAFTAPTMLQFAAPFAAAFASTMLFSRMASDQEIVACCAGGISYRMLLLPVLLLGLSLTLLLYIMSNSVLPTFYRLSAATLERDLLKMVVSRVQNRDSVKIGDWILHAEAARETDQPPTLPDSDIQPAKLIMLEGVAVGRLRDGRLQDETTAARADLLLFRYHNESWMTITLKDGQGFLADRGRFETQEGSLRQVRLPSISRDHPSFYAQSELIQIGRDPLRFADIRQGWLQLGSLLASQELAQRMSKDLASHGLTLRSGRLRYQVNAGKVTRTSRSLKLEASESGAVEVEVYRDEVFDRRLAAPRGEIRIVAGENGSEPGAVLRLELATIVDGRLLGVTNQAESVELPMATWPEPVLKPLLMGTAYDMLNRAAKVQGQDEEVDTAAKLLSRSITRMVRKSIATINSRTAYSISAMLCLALGPLLSLRMRGSMPMVVFLWTFMLAMGNLVAILSGDSMINHVSMPLWAGMGVAWLGNALVLLYLFVSYVKICRN